MKNFLLISNNSDLRIDFQSIYPGGDNVVAASSLLDALEMLSRHQCEMVFVDLEILEQSISTSDSDYKAVLQPFRLQYPTIDIVVITPQEQIRQAVMVVEQGASDYILYPVVKDEIKLVSDSLRDSQIVQSELDYLRDKIWDNEDVPFIQTRCPAMSRVFDDVRSVAPTKSTVMITGETGTGKGVLAKLIHKYSNRRNEQFISVHCGAIPDTLLESELFGHEKGAFTGAIKRKLGKFEIANGGTIFLDEIGTITPVAQIKLLKVLQEGVVQRVGSEEDTKVDVRVIAASNEDLSVLCDEKRFRRDLFYRLNVFPVDMPPLKDRKEDIPGLTQTFIQQFNKYHSKDITDIHPQVIEAFLQYNWPGNIRELENIIERACILERSSILSPESFPAELFSTEEPISRVQVDTLMPLSEVRRRGVEEIERYYLKEVLESNKGKINQSAEVAGISTRQLHKLMKKYNLRKEEFKK